jgi:transcriptional regulator with XRE-family HTH domain
MPTEPTVLLSAQCRAARALIEWSPEQLARTAAVDLQTIREFEARFRRPDVAARQRIRIALEEAGVVFIDENGGGGGARLKFSRKEVRAIGRWESEGGAVGEDDI